MKKTILTLLVASAAVSSLSAEHGIVETTGLIIENGSDVYLTQTGTTGNPSWGGYNFGSFDVSAGETLVFTNFFFENYAYNGSTDNYLDADNTATLRILINNSVVNSYQLTQDSVDGNNRNWSISGGTSLNALDGLSIGNHSIAFEIDYTYNFWNGTSKEVFTAENADTGSANFAISAVPEPASFALIAGMLGLAHVALRNRRR